MYSKPTDLRFYWPLYCGGVKHFIWSELGLFVVKIVLCCSAYSVCVLYVLIAQCCVLCYVFCVAGVGAAPGAPRRDHRDCAACDSVTTPQQGGIYSSICQCSNIHISKQEQAIANARLTLNDINTQEWIFRLPGTACFFGFLPHLHIEARVYWSLEAVCSDLYPRDYLGMPRNIQQIRGEHKKRGKKITQPLTCANQ